MVSRGIQKRLCHQEEAVWTRRLVLQTTGRSKVRLSSPIMIRLPHVLITVINVINNNEYVCLYLWLFSLDSM